MKVTLECHHMSREVGDSSGPLEKRPLGGWHIGGKHCWQVEQPQIKCFSPVLTIAVATLSSVL